MAHLLSVFVAPDGRAKPQRVARRPHETMKHITTYEARPPRPLTNGLGPPGSAAPSFSCTGGGAFSETVGQGKDGLRKNDLYQIRLRALSMNVWK